MREELTGDFLAILDEEEEKTIYAHRIEIKAPEEFSDDIRKMFEKTELEEYLTKHRESPFTAFYPLIAKDDYDLRRALIRIINRFNEEEE